MPATNGVDEDVPKHIVDEIKETFVFRDENVYNKKTGRQLKRYGSNLINDKNSICYGIGWTFKLKNRVIDYGWAKTNLK